MTALIDTSVEEMVKERLRGMKEPVTLKVFSQKGHCLFCNEMINLMDSVAKLNDKISIEKCDCSPDDPESRKYNIKHHPAVAILGEKDYGIRFFGVPAGKEFTTLIESIMLVSERTTKLPAKVMEMLAEIDKKVNLKVFVTLECPYCPAMVLRAHKLALVSDNITAEMVEASQFSELAAEHDIFGVPNTIIDNGKASVEGLVTEEVLLKEVMRIIKLSKEPSSFT